MAVPYTMTAAELEQTRRDLLAAVASDDPQIAETLDEFLTFFESAIIKYKTNGKTENQQWGEVVFPTPDTFHHFKIFCDKATLFQSAARALKDEAIPDYRTEYLFFVATY